MRINCDTAQEYYLQQAIKDKLQGYSFTHPKCTASKLLQLATELQKLKEEFYTGGNYTCDPPPPHTHTHRATASHTPKCTASKLLQLATELQKLKEEFYTGGNKMEQTVLRYLDVPKIFKLKVITICNPKRLRYFDRWFMFSVTFYKKSL